MRPTDVPDTGLLCDLLWSDPDKDITGWSENDRGVRCVTCHGERYGSILISRPPFFQFHVR